MNASAHHRCVGGRRGPPRAAFTLVEMLVVTSLISLMAAALLVTMWGVLEEAKQTRTRSQIAKLNGFLLQRWESYHTRPAPIRILPPVGGQSVQWVSPRDRAAKTRLLAIRELMRMELPDRKTDVIDPPAVLLRPETDANGNVTWIPVPPTLWRTYRRRARAILGPNWANDWNIRYQGAECLYLIVSAMREGDTCALDFFQEREIGDTDGDGMLEILDGWGRPIEFLRWAPGYRIDTPAGSSTMQVANAEIAPDPFDPHKVDPWWDPNDPTIGPFALYPLIFSAGKDRAYDIATDDVRESDGAPISYKDTKDPQDPNLPWPNDPYFLPPRGILFGTVGDANNDGELGFADNITNHFLEMK